MFICEINPAGPIPYVKNILLGSAGRYDVDGTADEWEWLACKMIQMYSKYSIVSVSGNNSHF